VNPKKEIGHTNVTNKYQPK